MLLIATGFVLRMLNLNFPEVYMMEFSPRFVMIPSSDVSEPQKVKLTQSINLCEKLNQQNPAVVSRLELGYTFADAIDKIISACV